MINRKTLTVLLSVLLTVLSSHAQQKPSKKALEAYEKAVYFYHLGEYDKTLDLSRQALKYTSKYLEPYMLTTEVYLLRDDKEAVLSTLQELVAADIEFPCYVFLTLAQTKQKMGDYEAVQNYLSQYESCPEKNAADEWNFELLKKNCEFALNAIENPVDFSPENMGAAVNSEFSEYLPCLTIDGKELFFTRLLPVEKPANNNKEQEDFFVSHWEKEKWSDAEPLGDPINSAYNEGSGTFSADGRILIFTACAIAAKVYGGDREGYGSCDLFYAVKEGDSWNNPQNMGGLINTALWESQPSLSADGKVLYFIRGDKTRNNSGDIYVSYLQQDNSWGKPIKLPDNINSRGKEQTVFIHPDDKTLYFSSNGHPGMGGFDIFMTTKLSDSTWSDPLNLGYPINTHRDENSIMISRDGKTAYFASERGDGFGKMDIYCFELPKFAQPKPVSFMRGKVFDREDLTPLQARVQLYNTETGMLIHSFYSDKINGEFLSVLSPNREYMVNVFAPDYLFYSDNFRMKEDQDTWEPYVKEIPLQRITVGKSAVLRNIFFDFDKVELKPESESELSILMEFLRWNSAVHIEVEGHTDNQGGEQYNFNLSEERAKAVRNYLISNGVDEIRLTYRGYGSSRPIAPNDTEEGRSVNRRTEFKITKE
ncbi:MAG: OmpA family protein [Bacteroidales bacterium]|jgi:outer membrane protein OmpA-like peptidoglycan-associated protein/tetratricopeptide (TPR) repeat protein|nr:OmpA family protein [Bacteroidales bacterium]